MSFVLRYVMVAIACMFFVLGMQLPNLTDQYAKRVDAHLREVTVNFQPFQEIANAHTQGNIEALIALHRKSDVAPFRAEGDAIERLYKRKLRFAGEHKALQTHLPGRLFHVLWRADAELREQTLLQYSATAPLNQEALIAGAVIALLAMLFIEGVLALTRGAERAATRWINHRWRGAK